MNILFIITDQQRADHLSCMGHPVLKTPNIDRIADGGVRFNKYYSATPVCMPNRCSFFTGLYPSVHKTRSNGINLNPAVPTLSGILRENGYHTCNVGKLHFNFYANSQKRGITSLENLNDWLNGKLNSANFPLPYYGFKECSAMTTGHGVVCTGHYIEWIKQRDPQFVEWLKQNIRIINEYVYDTDLPEELYPTSYITDQTVEFLERHSQGTNGDKPFFLHCSYNDPHHPVCPPGKYRDMYKPEDIELPSNFNDSEKLLSHPFLGQYIRNSRYVHLLPQNVDEEIAKRFIAYTFGSIAMIDDGIGKILTCLEKTGLAENTMIIFTSDHGDYCGDHGLILKGPAHYRSVINMPLLWKIPGTTKTTVSDSLVNTIDLPKTILNLLGIKKKQYLKHMQGQNITPLLTDPSAKVRNQILIEHDEEIWKDTIFRVRSLITETHRLSIYEGYDDFGDIFDYQNDPDELENLWYTDKELKNELVKNLLAEIIKYQPKSPERSAYN